MYEMT